MAWVRLDDGFFRHPKVIAAGPLARELFLASVCWSAANLTDGAIPRVVLPTLLLHDDDVPVTSGRRRRAVDRLLAVGLWELNGDGWMIHDYLDYNPSRARTLADRAAARRRQQRHREQDQ